MPGFFFSPDQRREPILIKQIEEEKLKTLTNEEKTCMWNSNMQMITIPFVQAVDGRTEDMITAGSHAGIYTM